MTDGWYFVNYELYRKAMSFYIYSIIKENNERKPMQGEREGEVEGSRGRGTGREGERDRDRERGGEGEGQGKREGGREGEGESDRQTDRHCFLASPQLQVLFQMRPQTSLSSRYEPSQCTLSELLIHQIIKYGNNNLCFSDYILG